MVCPNQTSLVNGICSNCPPNALFINGICQCNSGFILDSMTKECVLCSSIPNAVWNNGFCIACRKGQTFNQRTSACECSTGFILQGSKCIQNCRADEILTANGSCYSCPSNMVASNGICICARGYTQDSSGCGCSISCSSNQFVFMGGCAQCPLNTIY